VVECGVSVIKQISQGKVKALVETNIFVGIYVKLHGLARDWMAYKATSLA